MSERSVAEIIGWRILDGEVLEGDEHDGCCTLKWVDPSGEVWDMSCEPPEMDADDLLGWLEAPRGDGWYIHIHNNGQPHDLAPPDKRWSVHRSKSGGGSMVVGEGLTLLAALEAAVRKVAAEETA